MVDALSSGGSECMLVGVQVPPLAPAKRAGTQGFQPFCFPEIAVLGPIGTKRGVLGYRPVRSRVVVCSSFQAMPYSGL